MNLKYDILSIQERAVKRAKEGARVINGCAGMLFEDDKSLCIYDEVNHFIETNFTSYLAYPEVLGSSDYEEGVLSWLFQDKVKPLKEKYQVGFAVTLGGTGALSMLFSLTADNEGLILLSDIRWPNYDTIAKEAKADINLYHMIKDDKLDISSIKASIDEGLKKYSNILLVVNDPCHNPLGYCLSKEEYRAIKELLNSYSGKVSLLLDIAYIDYDPLDRYYEDMLLSDDVFFPVHLAFSCSKSFGLYGLRLGALISFLDKKVDLPKYLDSLRAYARGTYSCANNGAMGPVSLFFKDEEAKEKVMSKLTKEIERLKVIGKELVELLDELNIPHYPYKGGFYLTFKTEDSISYCQELEKKDIYFAPIDKTHIRIAVSGLNSAEIKELKRRLLE